MASILDLSKERDAHIDQRLHNDPTIWLNTVRPDGRPHAVVVWFMWDGEAILIFSQPDTHAGSDPITIEGTATLLNPGEANTAHPSYIEKYGERIKEIGYTPEQMALAYSPPIRIIPARVM